MASTEASTGDTETNPNTAAGPTVGVVLGALGILTAVWAYWLVLPGIVFGLAALVLGVRANRQASSEAGSVAIALGIAAVLLVPSVLFMIDGAEDWGRECTLNPSNPDC